MNCVIHTIGTSILTNILRSNILSEHTSDTRLITAIANIQDKELLSSEQTKLLEALEQLDATSLQDLDRKKISAELNAFYGYREKLQEEKSTDIHYLLYTDTLVGEIAANLLKKVMEQDGYHQVVLQKMEQLNTASVDNFHNGIKQLFGWLEKTLTVYTQNNRSNIIFNLTGGFKALQGYMNIAGMFYADKVVYIFESSNEVIEIPKLPIAINDPKIQTYAKEFLIAEVQNTVESHYVKNLDAVYKEEIDNLATLSPIGLLAWHKYKRDILSKNLLDFDGLVYEDSFHKDFKDKLRDVVKLQECLAKVSYLLQENNHDTGILKKDGGLQYEIFHYNRNIGHFRVSQETRVSCMIKNGKLHLLHFGEHDYVNDKP